MAHRRRRVPLRHELLRLAILLSLVFGTLLIMVTIRLVRRASKSTLIGGLAGILLTFDGLEFVMSRTALLDIFVAFFVVAAVACLCCRPRMVPEIG